MATPLFNTKKEEVAIASVAAGFDQSDFDKKNYPLLPVRLETFGHVIFVNVDESAAPLNEYLGGGSSSVDGGLPAQLAEYLPMFEDTKNGIKSARSGRFEIKANWKLLVENFIEYYHLPSVHPSLCQTNHHRAQSSGNHVTFIHAHLWGISINPNFLPHSHKLGKENNETAWFFAIFPNVFCWLLPHSVFTLIVSPSYDAIERSAVRALGEVQMPDLLGRSIEHADLSVSKDALCQSDSEQKI